MATARLRAIEKRDRIIARYGDADGIRKTPEYLHMLIREEKAAESFSLINDEIKKRVKEH